MNFQGSFRSQFPPTFAKRETNQWGCRNPPSKACCCLWGRGLLFTVWNLATELKTLKKISSRNQSANPPSLLLLLTGCGQGRPVPVAPVVATTSSIMSAGVGEAMADFREKKRKKKKLLVALFVCKQSAESKPNTLGRTAHRESAQVALHWMRLVAIFFLNPSPHT